MNRTVFAIPPSAVRRPFITKAKKFAIAAGAGLIAVASLAVAACLLCP